MTKYIFILFFLYGNAVAQQKPGLLIPFFDGQKYGFCNESGKQVIPAKYDQAYPFFPDNELTMVLNQGKPIIINRKGKKLIEASTDYINDNDLTNHQIYKYKPEEIALNINCLADTCPGFHIIIKPDNKRMFDKIGNYYFVKAQNKVFLIDSKGKRKTKEYDRIRHMIDSEVEYAISEDHTLNKYGLINNKGEELLECVYDAISYLGEGKFELSQAGKNYPYKTNYNQNYKPKEIPQKVYDKNRHISRRDGIFGVTDSLKNILLPYEYKKLYPLSNDNYLFWKDDSVGIVNLSDGNLYVHKLIVNLNGISGSADFVPFVPFTDKLAFLNNGEYWILANTDGKDMIDKVEGIYIDFQNFAGTIAGICVNGKIGVIDNKGNILFDFNFDDIYCLSENSTFLAKKDKAWLWYNINGTIIDQNIEEFNYVLSNYLMVKKDDKWFFVNNQAKAFVK